MTHVECPKCHHQEATVQYGGERGEAGPFVYCEACDYDEEVERRKAVNVDQMLTLTLAMQFKEVQAAVHKYAAIITDLERQRDSARLGHTCQQRATVAFLQERDILARAIREVIASGAPSAIEFQLAQALRAAGLPHE